MSVQINLYNNLSAIYWRPINFNLIDNKSSLKKEQIYFNNSTTFNVFEAFKNPKDSKFNRRTGLLLTNVLNNSSIFLETIPPLDSSDLKFIETPLLNPRTNQTFSLSSYNQTNILIETNHTELKQTDVLTFSFTNNNKVRVSSKEGLYLTAQQIGNYGLTFTTKIIPDNASQLFDYLLGNDEIILFKSETNYQIVVAMYSNGVLGLINNPYTNITSATIMASISAPTTLFSLIGQPSVLINSLDSDSYSSSVNAISSNIKFKFASVDLSTFSKNSIQNSFLVKYNASPLQFDKYLKTNQQYTSREYFQNYLAIFPYEYPSFSDKEATYPLQIHGLKNYQTPEYNYSTAPHSIFPQTSIRRKYEQIFSGSNQIKGYNNVYLGYQSDTLKIVFPTDSETAFHFPPTAPPLYLYSTTNETSSFSGLIEDGAIAGEIPFTSDRIFMKQIDYKEQIPGLPQPPNITRYNNTWLCSWLSGSNDGEKIWMDRFYNASYYTLDEALSAKALVYHDKLDPTKTYSYDLPSSLILYPGVLYRYYRVGQKTSREFLNFLNENSYLPKGSKILDISKWNSSPLKDESNYNNEGLVFYNKKDNFQNEYWVLDGSNHAIFPARSILLQNNTLTVSLWLYVDDWSNIQGNQIFGNYYNSGFGLVNEKGVSSSLFTIINQSNGSFYNINYQFKAVSDNQSGMTFAQYVIRLPDLGFYIIDPLNLKIKKYYSENRIDDEYKIPILTNIISKIDQVELDSTLKLYIFDKSTRKVIVLYPSGDLYNIITNVDADIQRIEIDLQDNLIFTYGDTSVIDSYNNVWYIVGSNLYKNDKMVATIGYTQQITADSNGNIWLSHGQDSITKINQSGQIEFSIRIGKRANIRPNVCLTRPGKQYRFLNFITAPKKETPCDPSTNIKTEDLLIIVDDRDKEIFLIDQEGNLRAKLDIKTKISLDQTVQAYGDFSGYQYLRKFGSFSNNLSWKFKIAQPNGFAATNFSLSYDSKTLSPGWHFLSFVFNAAEGYAKSYVDNILTNEISFTRGIYQLYYDYRAPLLLGATSIRNYTLNDIIGIDDAYKFIGRVADLKMYAKSLTKGEIEQLYFSSPFVEKHKDLLWNMRVGTRNYIEEIKYWFQMQLPGNKSKFYNINIHNFKANDNIKHLIENALRNNIHKISPAESTLYKINWM
jgi:hypothetical protein